MLRTATPRFPPKRCHAAVERTAHATPYAPQAGVRRPIFLSAEVSASQQQQYDPPTGIRPRKGWPNSMRWLVAFSPGNFTALAIQGLDYPFNRLAGNCNSHSSGCSTEIACT
jgi:hypothetical protein